MIVNWTEHDFLDFIPSLTMYSRAHLLIQRDWDRLEEEKPWGIEAHPVKEYNLFELTAKVLGLKGTMWEGGIFRLYLKFDENYGSRPPEVCFHTIPFHPNVDMITGRPCVDFLDDWQEWVDGYSLTLILLTVQVMLSNPVLENAVNSDAVQMLINHPHAYKQMVQDCVTASQRVEAGLSPHITEENQGHRTSTAIQKQTEQIPNNRQTATKRVSKISFEDYHSTWSGIATSKANPDQKNPLLEALKDNPNLQTAHYGLPLQELQEQADKVAEEQRTLMYGKFQPQTKQQDTKQAKLEKVNKMRKIYLQPRTPIKTPDVGVGIPKGEDGWEGEDEVDALVAWTQALDEDLL